MDALHNYQMTVLWSEEDEAYVALVPAFPGLSALAATPNAALAELQPVLEAALDIYREDGRDLPPRDALPTYSGKFLVRVPKTLHARLARVADAEGVSLNAYINTVLAQAVGGSTPPRGAKG